VQPSQLDPSRLAEIGDFVASKIEQEIEELNRQKEEIDKDPSLNKKRKQNLKKKLRKKLKRA